MPAATRHPVLGQLVPDQWDDDLLTFRQFPQMRPFWHPGGDKVLDELSQQQRQYVEDYENHIAELAPICRNCEVHTALQSRGVYELSVQVAGAEIMDQQVAAYEFFCANEAAVCRKMTDALRRYYNVARERMADWFDEDDDYPIAPTSEMLGRLVAFDGFTIQRSSAGGVAALRVGWDPEWDSEHGLLMAVYKDEVLAIGNDDVDDFLSDPAEAFDEGIWTTDDMNATELRLRQEFADQFEPADEE